MKKTLLIVVMVSVLWLMFSCSGDKGQMLKQLEALEEMNRADSVMRNDSLAESLAAYFDKHGTANERMRAHYILGRTYFDLGELPRALETYYEAADCADTTAADCDYKTLSRIHAQAAEVFNLQALPLNELSELQKAIQNAYFAKDTLMAIECYSLKGGAYRFLHQTDSVIFIKENAARMFLEVNKKKRYAQTLGAIITALLERGDISKAKQYKDIYESSSGFFDDNGNLHEGREIYNYIRGKYYLAINELDSAEFSFRKLLNSNLKLNEQIAGSRGLQEVFEYRGISDSLAKYANQSYVLNDSAYILSEMENIQKMQASYNFNHNKQLAEQSRSKAEHLKFSLTLILAIISFISLILLYRFILYKREKEQQVQHYKDSLDQMDKIQTDLMSLSSDDAPNLYEFFQRKMAELDELQKEILAFRTKSPRNTAVDLEVRLTQAPIVNYLKELVNANPYRLASLEDMKNLRSLINQEIPTFYGTLNTPQYTLSAIEYDVSVLLRVRFTPMDIHKLTGISTSYISNMRSRLLLKVYGVDGTPKDYDQRILAIK